MSGWISHFMVVVFGTLIAGCGQLSYLRPPADALRSSATSNSLSSSDCSRQPYNITSNRIGLGAATEFRACSVTTDFFKTTISGELSGALLEELSYGTSAICFFPAQYYAASGGTPARVVYKIGEYGTPMYQCVATPEGGVFKNATLEFKNTTYDYLYAVAIKDLEAMQTCLVAANASLCPPYARGKFRSISAAASTSQH